MKSKIASIGGLAAGVLVAVSASLIAGQVTLPNTFNAGTPAIASQVNANFNAVAKEVNENAIRITTMESELANLRAQLANVLAINQYLSVQQLNGQPAIRMSGVNLQIVNGSGQTNTINGTGNLIIGYDAQRRDTQSFCSIGSNSAHEAITDQMACLGNGGTWAVSHKTGSHNLIVGDQNNYSRFGGIVGGTLNSSIMDYASVTGGRNNTASHLYSSVSGGFGNRAIGPESSVTGGIYNTAKGWGANVSGGGNGFTSGGNSANHDFSSILGGVGQSSISNGQTIPALP